MAEDQMAEQLIVPCKVDMADLAVAMVAMVVHVDQPVLEDHMVVALEDQHIIKVLQLQENMEAVVLFVLSGLETLEHSPQLTLAHRNK
jgi:hypothetical protein